MNHYKILKYFHKLINHNKSLDTLDTYNNIYNKKIIYYLNGGNTSFTETLETYYEDTKTKVDAIQDSFLEKYQSYIDKITAYISKIEDQKNLLNEDDPSKEAYTNTITKYTKLIELLQTGKTNLEQRIEADKQKLEAEKQKIEEENARRTEIENRIREKNMAEVEKKIQSEVQKEFEKPTAAAATTTATVRTD